MLFWRKGDVEEMGRFERENNCDNVFSMRSPDPLELLGVSWPQNRKNPKLGVEQRWRGGA